MVASKITAMVALAALSEQALAFNNHRHLHQEAERKVVIDWTTVWDVVTVTGDFGVSSSTPTPTPTTPTTTSTPTPTTTSTTSTTTSTTPTSTSTPPPPPPPTTTHHSTTLATVAKAVNSEAANAIIPSISVPISISIGVPTHSSSSPAPTTTKPSTGGSTGSKRGIGYNDPLLAAAFKGECSSCGWAYNWGSNPDGLSSALTYIPMLWGPTSNFLQNWDSDAEKAISNGATHMFSFNEPDNAGQCNISPSAAASAHQQYMNKYGGRVAVGAPAITNSASSNQGLDWLQQFFDACDGNCQVDFCNLHWYNTIDAADDLFDHLEAAQKVCGDKPLWLTEFAPTDGSASQIADFLSDALPKLDSLSYLAGYSYFMVATDNLLSSATALSEFGQVYAS